MKNDDLKVNQKVWAMVGAFPVKLEVTSVYSLTDMMKHISWHVWLISKERRTVYQRKPYQLFKTYEELRDFTFPPLTNKTIKQ